MGLVREMLAQRTIQQSDLANPEQWLLDRLGASPAASGMVVNEETAMRVTAVYGCVRVLANAIASLPCQVLQATDRGKSVVRDHDLYEIVHDEPNDEMTSFQWREAKSASVLLSGNTYSYISMNLGRVAALWPLMPNRVRPYRDLRTRELLYDLTLDDGRSETVSRWNMLHVPGLGFDGLVGRSPIGYAREAIGLALVTERHGATYFGNGARPGIVLETEKPLKRQATQNVLRMWNEDHQGADKLNAPSVLSDGLKLHAFEIQNEDAQFLQTRGFQLAEICRLFGVPSWMVNDTDKSTSWGTGIESMGIGFVMFVLTPWLRRWEQAMNRILFTAADRREGFFVEFNVDGLLRGDFKTRMDGYQIAAGGPFMSRNEVRRRENLDERDGLDDVLENLNQTTPAGRSSAGRPAAVSSPAAAPAGREVRQAFRPLLEQTWTRVLRRAQKDHPGAAKRGKVAELWEEIRGYALQQIEPIAVAFAGSAGVRAPIVLLAADQVLDQVVLEDPAAWNVEALAGAAAERILGD